MDALFFFLKECVNLVKLKKITFNLKISLSKEIALLTRASNCISGSKFCCWLRSTRAEHIESRRKRQKVKLKMRSTANTWFYLHIFWARKAGNKSNCSMANEHSRYFLRTVWNESAFSFSLAEKL